MDVSEDELQSLYTWVCLLLPYLSTDCALAWSLPAWAQGSAARGWCSLLLRRRKQRPLPAARSRAVPDHIYLQRRPAGG